MRSIVILLMICTMALGGTVSVMASEIGGKVMLPTVNLNRGTTTMQALQNRKSSRTFSEKELSLQDISDLLWAANGMNRPGKHTNASGKNKQSIEIYVCLKSGAYLYLPQENAMRLVSKEDLRPAVASWQKFAAAAPVSIVVASNLKDPLYQEEEWKFLPAYDAGIVSANIYLFCAANDFATICRTTMERDKLKASLNLSDKHVLHLNHPVGLSPDSPASSAVAGFPKGKKAIGEHYTGNVFISPLADNNRSGIAYLIFEQGSHNDWHIHPDAQQIMIVLDGDGVYQEEGKAVRHLKAGDVVITAPNVKHWNGATPSRMFRHLSISDVSAKGHIEWCGKVSAAMYLESAGKTQK